MHACVKLSYGIMTLENRRGQTWYAICVSSSYHVCHESLSAVYTVVVEGGGGEGVWGKYVPFRHTKLM